jgi:hypothetical protein
MLLSTTPRMMAMTMPTMRRICAPRAWGRLSHFCSHLMDHEAITMHQ